MRGSLSAGRFPWKASIGYRNIGGNVSKSLVSRRFGVLAEIRYFEPVSFVPAECFGEDYRQNWIVGVPSKKIFEHLEATVAEATPLYELCAGVLNGSP